MRNTGVFILAVILFLIVAPIGFLYGVISSLLFSRLSAFVWNCAFSLDQTGNAFCAEFFNHALIKRKDEYLFGDPDQTVSHVLGKNKEIENLTRVGTGLANVLNWLDENHVEDAAQNE